MRPVRFALTVLAVVLLTACGGDKDASRNATLNGVSDEQLPTPAGAPGSAVTGMPDAPGPGQVGPPVAADTASAEGEVALDENGNPLPVDGVPVDPATVPAAPPEGGDYPIADDEPTPQDAVAVVRDYYAAINGRNYARAFALWSDGGRASGPVATAVRRWFCPRPTGCRWKSGAGRVDAAAGSRYIEVPVAVTATRDDGSERKYVGAYTLRRAVVDGATPEQRAWRIASADLREVQP